MAALQRRPVEDMVRRFADGHRAYVSSRDGIDAAWGWVATRTAIIGELATTLSLPPGARYLWNFVTLPAHRGHGVYPQLLRAILRREAREASTFWIAYAPENHASAAGIRKAGFRAVAELSFDAAGHPATHLLDNSTADSLTQLLDLPQRDEPLTPCWRCVRAGRSAMSCSAGSCACDYQRAELTCAS